jgi:deoxyribonuclease-4
MQPAQPNGAPDELGAHVSSAGSLSNAPPRAAALDAVVLQLFTKQPSRWAERELTDDDTSAYRKAARHSRIRVAAAHDSYLINLASPNATLRLRSIDAFQRELTRCHALGIGAVVTHPGHATDGDVASAVVRNAEAVQQALEAVPRVHVLFETTPGAGRVLGASFDQLAELIERIPSRLRRRVGVCFDTCHVWVAGYDLRNAYDDVMARFDDTIGCERIRLFHLNDSLGERGSRWDRHAHIGLGTLGDQPFRHLLLDDRFTHVAKLLETPKDDDAVAADRRNLLHLRSLRS